MMKMEVVTDALFWGEDPVKTIRSVVDVGQKNIEFWMWIDKDLDTLIALQKETGFNLEVLTVPAYSLTDSKKLVGLNDSAMLEEYISGLKQTITYAKQLGCKKLSTQLGTDNGTPRIVQYEAMLSGLKVVAPIVEAAGMVLLIEPLQLGEAPELYRENPSDEAFRLVDEIGSENIKVLFDIYFQQKDYGGNILERILPNLSKIGHFHAAGSNGRHELPNGELNYPYIFKALDDAGYQGFTALEYFPLENPLKGIKEFL